MGKQLECDVTVLDALAPSRLNQNFFCNPRTTAIKAEARKSEKYCEIIDSGYIFQLVAVEIQGSLGEGSEIFITRLCKMLCRSLAAFSSNGSQGLFISIMRLVF